MPTELEELLGFLDAPSPQVSSQSEIFDWLMRIVRYLASLTFFLFFIVLIPFMFLKWKNHCNKTLLTEISDFYFIFLIFT